MPKKKQGSTGMKTKPITIDVPEIWLDSMGELPFRIAIQQWLEGEAPCLNCGGIGHYQPGNHLSDQGEVYCPECKGKEWENPLL
jgi:hypothetical protein